MENNEIVVGLDIGTTKICAIVGMRTEHGKIEILGMGKAESAGVSRGVEGEDGQRPRKIAGQHVSVHTDQSVYGVVPACDLTARC